MCEGGRREPASDLSAQHAPSAPRVSALAVHDEDRRANRSAHSLEESREGFLAFVNAEAVQIEPFEDLKSAAREFALRSRKARAMPPDGFSVVRHFERRGGTQLRLRSARNA